MNNFSEQAKRASFIRRRFVSILLLFVINCVPLFLGLAPLGCGGLASLATTDTTDGTTSGTTGESLTTTDSQLFEDGPVDLPVTIAKLDSPDLTLVTVTVTELASPSTSARFQTTATHRFTVTGAAGAANTEKVFVYDTATDEQVTADVEDDGSFTTTIDGALTDTLALSGMNSAESQVSPPLVITFDDNGNAVIATTNTASLNFDQNVMIDALGNYYMSVDNGDGTYALLRRNADGSQVETLVTSLSSQPRAVLSTSGLILTVILQDGSVVAFSAEPPALKLPTLSAPRPAYEDWVSTALDTISGGLPSPDQIDGTGFNMVMDSAGGALAISYPYINPQTMVQDDYLLKITDTNGRSSMYLLSTNEYDKADIQLGPDDTLYIFMDQVQQTSPVLVKMEFSAPGENGDTSVINTAFNNRQTLITGLSKAIAGFDVSDNGDVVYHYQSDSGTPISVYWEAATSSSTTISDINAPNFYLFPTMTAGSEIVVLCDVGVPGTQFGALVYWRVGDPTGEFTDLARFSDKYVCTDIQGSFTVTSDNLVYFVSGTDTTDAQMGVIDLTKVPELEDLF